MKKLPKSIRKYLRREKARLRRQINDTKTLESLISQLEQKFQQPSKTKDR